MSSGIQDAYIRWDREVTAPFTKLTRRVYPRTIRETFAWAEELWLHHGIYMQSISTAVRYFMTELDITGDDLDFTARKNYIKQIGKTFSIMEDMATIGDDYMGFGNSFTSMYRPFIRQLICSSCGFRAPLKKMVKYFTFSGCEFRGTCPTCGQTGVYQREDTPLPKDKVKPKITRWPPQYMLIKQHPLSKRTIYSLDLPQWRQFTEGIQKGDLLYLEDTPWEMIYASVHNQQFEFLEGEIYHMAAQVNACSMPSLKGWGLPPFMSDFETAVLVTMLDKYVETVIVEYLMPFRVLSPTQATGAQDPMMNLNMRDFSGSVMEMLKRHRRNPADWNFLPHPLTYQVMGGEAKNLIPVEILEHFEMRLLHSMGIPPEFYKASIEGFAGTGAGPVIGFKMFERTWQHFANELNKWASWAVNKLGDIMSWETVQAKLKPVSMYEDQEIRQAKLELAASGEISRDTAYAPLGLDAAMERAKVMDEDEERADEQDERQKRMEKRQANKDAVKTMSPGQMIGAQQQMAASAGDPSAGGAPMQGAPGQSLVPQGSLSGVGGKGATIDDLMGKADEIAQQLVSADPAARRNTLTSIKNQKPELHALVKSKLDQLEQQAKSQGVQMARQGQMPQ